MADYNSMKVPELKKLLNERGLTQAGNKADLIARLQDNDKENAKGDEAPSAAKKDGEPEDEIDYDDDDFPTPAVAAKPAATTTTTPASAQATEPKAATTTEPKATEAPVESTEAPNPEAATTTEEAAPAEGDKKDEEATEKTTEPLFSQHLAPTNAKTEAEKRAARAARFGVAADKDSEDSKKTERAERFGLPNDQVSALDSALPDRPRKRGRGGDDSTKDDIEAGNTRGPNKRRSTGGPQQQGGQGGGPGRRDNRHGGRRGGNDRRRQGGGGGGNTNNAGNANGQKRTGGGAPPAKAVDPAEKARMEARAKRFASAS